MDLNTVNERCVRQSSRRSSARSAAPCVRDLGYGEFRELVLMCAVHNIKQAVKP
jgi:hypothetical protein